MTANTYDASELYPYYEKALHKVLLNRRIIPMVEHWAKLPPDKWPQEYKELQEKYEKERVILFGNFPALIIDENPSSLLFKQIAHKLGATYITGRVARDLVFTWFEFGRQDFHYSPTNIDHLKPLVGLSPLFCVYGRVYTKRSDFPAHTAEKRSWFRPELRAEYECRYEIQKTFYDKARCNFDWGCEFLEFPGVACSSSIWNIFSIPTFGIEVAQNITMCIDITDKDTYTTYLETVCTSLQAVVACLQQKGIVTLPLSLPSHVPDENERKAIRAEKSAAYYRSHSVPALPPAVQRLLTSGNIPQTPQVQPTPAPVPTPALPPAPSVAPVPAPDDIFTDLENEIQRRLALKRA